MLQRGEEIAPDGIRVQQRSMSGRKYRLVFGDLNARMKLHVGDKTSRQNMYSHGCK
jgi:hypothetical protein